jgi:signal transduction histidine kinase
MDDTLERSSGWAGFWRDLSWRAVATALTLAVLAALALNPVFATPFPVVLGRMLFVAVVLLLAFALAGHWRQRWLPRWVAQVGAVVFAAPLATLFVYLLSTGGNVAAFVQDRWRVSGFVLIAGTGLVVGLVLALGALYRERDAQARSQALAFALERETLERQAADARLALLRSQIEPHFLFNTLANVQELVDSGSPRASEVLKSLTAYLRAAMPRLSDGAATLGDEEALVRAYLDLMLMRMPDRLAFEIDVDPALRTLRFPPMALLTLVENAVRHGIDPAEHGGRIEVGAQRVASGVVRAWVADSGVGMAEAAQPGTGLSNLRARMQAFFGPSATLELSEQPPHGVRAELSFQPT